jgi:hypothetical protein
MLSTPAVVTALAVVAVCGLGAGFLSGLADSSAGYRTSLHTVERKFYASRKRCEPLSSAEWAQCVTMAWSEMWQAVAQAEALHRNQPESFRVQRLIAANIALLKGMEQCSVLGDLPRAACDKAALEAYRRAVDQAASTEAVGNSCDVAGCPVVQPPVRAKRIVTVTKG